jgi:hypothetical protein
MESDVPSVSRAAEYMAEANRIMVSAPADCQLLKYKLVLDKCAARWKFLSVCPDDSRGADWVADFWRLKAVFDEAYPKYLEARAALMQCVYDINRLLKTWEG